MKRKGYAVVTMTIQREIAIELDDEKELKADEEEALLLPILEKQYGKFGDNDEFEVDEIDYAE